MCCRVGWKVCGRQWRTDKEEEANVTATDSFCDGGIVVCAHDDQVGRWPEFDGGRAGRTQWGYGGRGGDEGGWCEPVTVVVCVANVQPATWQSRSFIVVNVVKVLADEWGLISAVLSTLTWDSDAPHCVCDVYKPSALSDHLYYCWDVIFSDQLFVSCTVCGPLSSLSDYLVHMPYQQFVQSYLKFSRVIYNDLTYIFIFVIYDLVVQYRCKRKFSVP